jgi:hypothetical protein
MVSVRTPLLLRLSTHGATRAFDDSMDLWPWSSRVKRHVKPEDVSLGGLALLDTELPLSFAGLGLATIRIQQGSVASSDEATRSFLEHRLYIYGGTDTNYREEIWIAERKNIFETGTLTSRHTRTSLSSGSDVLEVSLLVILTTLGFTYLRTQKSDSS